LQFLGVGGSCQEAEIRRLVVRSQPGQIVCETVSQKRAGGAAQGVGSEFKPQYHKKKKKKKKREREKERELAIK
jgi:hypothetical protein